jgi:hypothetical protein
MINDKLIRRLYLFCLVCTLIVSTWFFGVWFFLRRLVDQLDQNIGLKGYLVLSIFGVLVAIVLGIQMFRTRNRNGER